MNRNGFIPWKACPPPPGVPLKIYCFVKGWEYSKLLTKEELEAWAKEDEDIEPVDWSRIGWKLTGIAREILGVWE